MDIETLQKENEELRKMNELKGDLISISAHQLRTSLSALKWILKMFSDHDFGELSPEQQSFIEKMSASNERMIALVNEMLTLNHEKTVALEYHFASMNIITLIEELMFDFSGEAFKKGVETIFLKPTTPLPDIIADKEKLRAVFQNLIENGIKYSNQGDKLFISLRPSDETGIEVLIKDTGMGIPEKDQSSIFSKFYRGENAKAKQIVGSGIGLYTTKNIVTAHSGTIRFESNEHGTTFFVTLPLQSKPLE